MSRLLFLCDPTRNADNEHGNVHSSFKSDGSITILSIFLGVQRFVIFIFLSKILIYLQNSSDDKNATMSCDFGMLLDLFCFLCFAIIYFHITTTIRERYSSKVVD